MKMMATMAAAIAMMSTPVLAGESEINYPDGSLGYSALIDGDYQAARDMIEADKLVATSDPAKLINLGYTYERLGNREKAASLYERARDVPREKLILSNGQVVDSRNVAKEALRRLSRSIATN